ncbi:MAG TPA: pectate lyase [Micromonosporaceae bacterium]|nr:pectate lyase [Micromonosporaceae bacterium]
MATVLALITIPAASAGAADGTEALNIGSSSELSWFALALGRQPLPANDGWAADGPGTTGGSAADADHVYIAHSRAELVVALGGNNATNRTNATPKIIYLAGTINGFEGADGALLSCADLADPGFSLDAYLAAYDPAVWGRVNPSGPLEDARVRSVANQTRQTQINVGPNTTIIGLRDATLLNLTLMLDGASNTIVRNVTFNDGRDCFPQWSPTDGATGNWNSQFDNASVRRSSNVWFDHNTFTDGDDPDSTQPVYFGRPLQWHDGNLDITHTSSLVTVSFNRFTNHDKVMLIGSSNTVGPDVGRLNVTLHHNLFDGVNQRLPRVRFGKVDVYNNAYRLAEPFDYALGVGVQSAIVAENNFFTVGAGIAVGDILHDWGGTVITEGGTWARLGDGPVQRIGLLDAYNATHDPGFGADAGWTPVLRAGPVLPAPAVPVVVQLLAGAGRLPV